MEKSTLEIATSIDPSEPTLEIRLLGGFSLKIQGEAVSGLSRPAQWLLALLVLRSPTPLAREWLSEALWPESVPDRSAFYLRRSLSELRTALGSEKSRLLSPARPTLQLDLANAFCDVTEFDLFANSSEEASLIAMIALYRGALLEECDSGWILPERERRRRRFILASESLAELQVREGNLNGSIALLRRVVETDSLRETAHRRLMQAMGKAGDYTGVERQYRVLRRVLRDELNIEPAEESVDLYRQLMQADRRPASESAPIRSTGSPKAEFFETLPSPSLSFQADAYSKSVPYALTPLVGRTRELEEVRFALQASRLVTLTGTGGVGKTRLSLAVAEKADLQFSDGVFFVDLSPIQDGKSVPSAVVASLGLHPNTDTTSEEALYRFIGHKRLLMILDNSEQVAEACARLAASLLQACPSLKILCTSRQPLFIPGETVCVISPLDVPPASTPTDNLETFAENLASYDSIKLLLDRIKRATPSFRLDSVNASAISQLCRQLDGIPLALELVAARFRSPRTGAAA